MHYQRQGTGARRGAAVLEFAIVAPVLFGLFLGIIEFARYAMVTELLTEAARQGCRVAIIPRSTPQQVKSAVTDCFNTLAAGEEATITVNGVSVDTVDLTTIATNTQITVQVSVSAKSVTWMPGTSLVSGNLSGQFSLRKQ